MFWCLLLNRAYFHAKPQSEFLYSMPRLGSEADLIQKSYHFPSVTDIQKKQPDSDCAPKATSSSGSSQADIFCNNATSSISQSLIPTPDTSEDPPPGDVGSTSLPALDGKTSGRKQSKRFFFQLGASGKVSAV